MHLESLENTLHLRYLGGCPFGFTLPTILQPPGPPAQDKTLIMAAQICNQCPKVWIAQHAQVDVLKDCLAGLLSSLKISKSP